MNFLTSCINFITSLFNLHKSKQNKESVSNITQKAENNLINNCTVNQITYNNIVNNHINSQTTSNKEFSINFKMIFNIFIHLLLIILIFTFGIYGFYLWIILFCVFVFYTLAIRKPKLSLTQIIYCSMAYVFPIIYITFYEQIPNLFKISIYNYVISIKNEKIYNAQLIISQIKDIINIIRPNNISFITYLLTIILGIAASRNIFSYIFTHSEKFSKIKMLPGCGSPWKNPSMNNC